MKYTIQDNETYKEFSEINIGKLFTYGNIPFIKIPKVRSENDNGIYNCVRLDNGEMYFYYSYEHVKRPKNYNLEIKM